MTHDIREADIQLAEPVNFAVAKFAARIPPNPKGIIAIAMGSNSDARDMIHDREWSRFADKHQQALVGIYFADKVASWVEQYIDVKNGSGDAYLTALEQLGLDGLPICQYGYSAGGELAYEFSCWRPDKVAAFVAVKGGVYMSLLAPEATRNIPALFISGRLDAAFRQLSIKAIFHLNQQAGCKWQHVENAGGHDIADSERRSMRLFESVL